MRLPWVLPGILLVALLALVACQDETGKPGPGSVTPPLPAGHQADRLKCLAEGGQYRRGGLIGFACFKATPDGGKSCSDSSDCSGFCLADTRSCSPETPFFGCHAVLHNGSDEVAICID